MLDVHWSLTCSVFGSIGFAESFLVVLIYNHPYRIPEIPLDKFFLFLVGILSFLAQSCLVLSAHFENATTVALLKTAFDVFFAFIFQITLFKELPSFYKICGTILISFAIISSGSKKIIENLSEDHWMKKSRIYKFLCEGLACYFPVKKKEMSN